MFKVCVGKNKRIYYVWGPHELVETKKLNDYSYCASTDNDLAEYAISDCGDHFYAYIEHANPQIISEEDLLVYLENDVNKSIENSSIKDRYEVRTMPCTSITEEEYDLLFAYASAQGTFDYPKTLAEDLKTAKKTLRKKLDNM